MFDIFAKRLKYQIPHIEPKLLGI